MDALEQAQAQEDALLERRIAAVPRSGSGRGVAAAGRDCAECGAPIPAKRLSALLCIGCQNQTEREAGA